MTLKLVAIDGNVAPPDLGIADELRDLADRIDAGEYPDVVRIVPVVETETNLGWEILGKSANGFELLGIFYAAMSMTLRPEDD